MPTANILSFAAEQVGTVVGHVDIPPGTTYRELFEFAAWYRNHEYVPGRYPVKLVSLDRYGECQLVAVDVPTKITAANFRSHFGGVGYGEDTAGRSEIGNDDSAHYVVGHGYDRTAMTVHRSFVPLVDFPDACAQEGLGSVPPELAEAAAIVKEISQ